MNAYLFALRENADEKTIDKIEDALTPPLSVRVNGVPVGFGEDEMWAEWEMAARAPVTPNRR